MLSSPFPLLPRPPFFRAFRAFRGLFFPVRPFFRAFRAFRGLFFPVCPFFRAFRAFRGLFSFVWTSAIPLAFRYALHREKGPTVERAEKKQKSVPTKTY